MPCCLCHTPVVVVMNENCTNIQLFFSGTYLKRIHILQVICLWTFGLFSWRSSALCLEVSHQIYPINVKKNKHRTEASDV